MAYPGLHLHFPTCETQNREKHHDSLAVSHPNLTALAISTFLCASKAVLAAVDFTKVHPKSQALQFRGLTIQRLIMATIQAADSTPVYFWREYGDEHGYLSQWYHSPFHTDNGPTVIYQTAEQYMMHQKALLFSDHEIAAKILRTTVPKEQKALGRRVSNFSQEIWEANRERIVEEGSYFKFKYGEDEGEGKEDGLGLKAKLLATGDREIVEASPSN